MSFPSTKYNAYSVMSGSEKKIKTWTDKERVVLLIRADVLAEIDVEVLASAFNIDKADFMGRVIPVDEFENESILGLICDESFFQIYDNIFRFDESYNARVMAWNEYLHVWQTYAICPFANAVVLATTKPTPATAISVSTESIIGADVGDTIDGAVTLTPENSTSNVSYESDNVGIATIEQGATEKDYVVTAVGLGSTTLYAKTDNGKVATFVISVTGLPAESITFGADEIDLDADAYEIIELFLEPENATSEVTFTSDDSEGTYFTINKIDNKHVKITGVSAGTGKITATTDNSKTATIDVTINA